MMKSVFVFINFAYSTTGRESEEGSEEMKA